MLKKRIIPIELFLDGRLVKSKNFKNFRDVGDPVSSSKVYSDQDADELLILNISRNNHNQEKFLGIIKKIAECCFVPLAVGGKIDSYEYAAKLFDVGADKVVINSMAYKDLTVITQISSRYGSQAVVICIDVSRVGDNWVLFSQNGSHPEQISFEDHIQNIKRAGAGELILQSVDFDGSMAGYDLKLLEKYIAHIKMPIILAGGAGNFSHLREAFLLGADAVACGSLFNFGDNNPLRAKAYLKNYAIPLKKV